jgi:hypothetical protein
MATQNQILVISDPHTVNALQNFLAYKDYMQQHVSTDPRISEEQIQKMQRYEEPRPYNVPSDPRIAEKTTL